MNIVAVVVTYNRKELLIECIQSILKQSFEVNKVIIVDNNSNDGTYDLLNEKGILNNNKILYLKLKRNIGGAGGFYEGIKKSIIFSPDWVWVMDDDTIPSRNCLENLVNAIPKINEKISFLASSIYGTNNETMNVPAIKMKNRKSGYDPDWYIYLKDGIVKIGDATFVSILINADSIKMCGLPIKDFFIWGDDTEYTSRLVKYYADGFFVGSSYAIHKRKLQKQIDIIDEINKNRIKLYYYSVRNSFIIGKYYRSKYTNIKNYIFNVEKAWKILFRKGVKYKLLKFNTIHKGIYAYLLKKYDYRAFKDRLDFNVKYKNK